MAEGSSTIATGGVAQQLLPAWNGRRGFFIQNNSTASITIAREGTATAAGPITVPAGQLFSTPPGMPCGGPISIFGATTGQAFGYGDWG